MTAREYRKMCRIKVNRLAKLLTYFSLIIFFLLAEYISLNGYYTAGIGTTIWFWMPDLAVYVLEHLHKIKHDFVSYR